MRQHKIKEAISLLAFALPGNVTKLSLPSLVATGEGAGMGAFPQTRKPILWFTLYCRIWGETPSRKSPQRSHLRVQPPHYCLIFRTIPTTG